MPWRDVAPELRSPLLPYIAVPLTRKEAAGMSG